jgi:hypothetical protein
LELLLEHSHIIDAPRDPTKPDAKLAELGQLPTRKTVRQCSTRCVELGAPLRLQMRGVHGDVEYLVQITVRPRK